MEKQEHGEARLQLPFPPYYSLPDNLIKEGGYYPKVLVDPLDQSRWKVANIDRWTLFKNRIGNDGTGERQLLPLSVIKPYCQVEDFFYIPLAVRIEQIRNLSKLMNENSRFQVALMDSTAEPSFLTKGYQAINWSSSNQPNTYPYTISHFAEDNEPSARWGLLYLFESTWINVPNELKNPESLNEIFEKLIRGEAYPEKAG